MPEVRASVRRVLVVDDNLLICRMLHDILVDGGYAPVTTQSAEDALDYLFSVRPPDLLVVDYHLPGAHGAALAQVLREGTNPTLASMPIVAFSSSVMNDLVPTTVNFRLAGVCSVLAKPFSRADFLATVSAALDRRLDCLRRTCATGGTCYFAKWQRESAEHEARGSAAKAIRLVPDRVREQGEAEDGQRHEQKRAQNGR